MSDRHLRFHASLPVAHALAGLALVAALAGCGKKGPPPPPTTAAPTTAAPATTEPTVAPDAGKAEPADAGPAMAPDTEQPTAPTAAAAPDAEVKAEAKLIPVTSKSAEAVVAFEDGRSRFYNFNFTDALASFKKAVELDPAFLQAQAYAGFVTPSAEGEAMLAKVAADPATASLPEAERVHIEYLLANRQGDTAKVVALAKKVTELAPDDWQGYLIVGQHAFAARDFDGAVTALTKASELNPKAGSVYNMLGYTLLEQGKREDAVAALQKYVELAPGEANPLDSLGEAQLMAGKLADAEASFMKAAAADAKFVVALEGAATARALQGNWQGAHEALTAAIAQAPRPIDKAQAERQLAWLMVTEGKHDEGLAAFAKMATEGSALAGLDQAYILIEDGKLEDAAKATAAAWERAQKPDVDTEERADARRMALAQQAIAAAQGGRPDDAKKALGELEALVKPLTDDADAQITLRFARGRVLIASDPKAAVAELAGCPDVDAHCNYYEARAAQAAGDAAAATAAEQAIANNPRRSMDYVWVVTRLKAR